MGRENEMVETLRTAVEQLLGSGPGTYSELSVAALSAQAGISRPTFYAYFRDKNALLEGLAVAAVKDLRGSVDERKLVRTRAELDATLDELVAAYARHRVVLAAVAEVASYEPVIRTFYHGGVEGVARRLASHIERGRRRPGIDPGPTARWLVWTAERGLRRAHDRRAKATPADLQGLADMFWFTLYA